MQRTEDSRSQSTSAGRKSEPKKTPSQKTYRLTLTVSGMLTLSKISPLPLSLCPWFRIGTQLKVCARVITLITAARRVGRRIKLMRKEKPTSTRYLCHVVAGGNVRKSKTVMITPMKSTQIPIMSQMQKIKKKSLTGKIKQSQMQRRLTRLSMTQLIRLSTR